MLSKPRHGWTEFSLIDTSAFELSYLDDIALEWLDQAIRGLETMYPFCVKGFLEPRRFLCVVSYWNCHIIVEDDEREPLTNEDIHTEFSHTSMLDFCKFLYQDISSCIDDWASFADHFGNEGTEKKRRQLQKKLRTLGHLITAKESLFSDDRCFL